MQLVWLSEWYPVLRQGRLLGKVDAYFSSFRRCNYPKVSPQGGVEIIEECGRYSRFWDIPSPWWQASTVLVGTGSALSLLVAVTATAACCITYVVHTGSARIAGSLQLTAALLVVGGAAIYPVGWDNREVRESCGNQSHVYKLGTCQLSWSVYLLSSARRHAVQQRVACRLANISAPPATRSSTKQLLPTPSSPSSNVTITIASKDKKQPRSQTTNDIEINEKAIVTITKEEKIVLNNSNEECYNHDAKVKLDTAEDINELKTFNSVQKTNSAALHERIVEQMIESSILNVPLPIPPSDYEYHPNCNNLPKCLMENNGGKFD
ncbi:hypothetical protein Trydic_g21544 [Trypoxylus dichotomus]